MTKKKLLALRAVLIIAAGGIGLFFFMKGNKHTIEPCYSELTWEMCSKQGVFFFDDYYLSFADPNNGKRVLICNTAGCTHEREKCSAVFDRALVNGVCLMGDKLIYLSTEGIKEKIGYNIYTADLNGLNRQKIAYISEIENISGVTIKDDRIVICYQNTWDENNRDLESPKAGVYIYDLKEKKGTKIYEIQEQNALISRFELMEKGVCFSEYYNDLSKKDITDHATEKEYMEKHSHSNLTYASYSGDETKVLSEEVELVSYLKTEGDFIYYIKENRVYQCNLDGSEKSISYLVKDNEKLSMRPAFGKEGFLIQRYQEKTETFKIDYYDLKTEKVSSYGESDCSVVAEYPDYTYIYVPANDSDVNLGYIKTGDMIQKKWEVAKPFGTEYLQQIQE